MKNPVSHFPLSAQPNQIRSACLFGQHQEQLDLSRPFLIFLKFQNVLPTKLCFSSGTAFITDVSFFIRLVLSVFFCFAFHFLPFSLHTHGVLIQWKPLIMITLGPALFDNNNRLITLSGGATWGTIVYQYSTIGEFLPLMEMRCV